MTLVSTWLAHYLLRNLRGVDPEVLADIKIQLQHFNARRKVWSEKPVHLSETQS